MSFTNAEELRILGKEYGATDYTPDGTLYAALFTTVPADDGTGGTEATGGNYARVAVTNNTTNFPSANPKLNGTAIAFPTATTGGYSSGATLKGMGFYSASSGGTLRSWAYLCDTLFSFVGLDTGDIIWAPGHTYTNGTKVIVWAPASQTLPTGLSAGTEYFVISASGDSFQVSTTSGGSAVAIPANGGGLVARSRFTVVNEGDTPSFAASAFSHLLD